MSGRGVPFHCPYCGDEDLWPHVPESDVESGGSGHGSWECHSCLRAFALRLLGQLPAPASVAAEREARTAGGPR